LDSLFEVDVLQQAHPMQKRAWFAIIADIARRYNGWELFATLGPKTVEEIRQEFPT
jgi:hypothetical protein